MDRLDAMHLFVRVAELGSFAAAAQQLGVARSVVTRQIAGLEAHLGVKLMARSTRRLTLTSAGAAYLEKCRVILNLVEAAEIGVAEERQTPRGNIRISLPLELRPQAGGAPAARFLAALPGGDAGHGLQRPPGEPDRGRHRPLHSRYPPARCRRRGPPPGQQPHAGWWPRRTTWRATASPPIPRELAHHVCLGYTSRRQQQAWQFVSRRATGELPHAQPHSMPTTAKC